MSGIKKKKRNKRLIVERLFFLILIIIPIFSVLFIINSAPVSAVSPPASGYFIQHGSVDIGTTKKLLTITPVNNISHAFVLVHQWNWQRNLSAGTTTVANAATNANYAMVSVYLLNETTIVFERNLSTNSIKVTWMVIEALNDEFFVQQGQKNFSDLVTTTTTDNIPIAVNNLSNVFAWQTLFTTYSLDNATNMMFYANATDANTITFKRGGIGALNGSFRWFVVEWNSNKTNQFKELEKGVSTLVGSETYTSPLNQVVSINKSSSFLFFQCIGTGRDDGPDQAATSGYINNDTSLKFYTHDALTGPYARECFWNVIDFGVKVGNREQDDNSIFATMVYTLTDNFTSNRTLNQSLVYLYSTVLDNTASGFPRGAVWYTLTSSGITYQKRLGGATLAGSLSNQTIAWELLELPFNYFPNVSALIEPRSYGLIAAQSVDFNFTANDVDNRLSNCTLWGNFTGSWAPNSSLDNPSETLINKININLSTGTYIWNIQCFDDYVDGSFYFANKTFYNDITPPTITNAVLNTTLLTQGNTVRLNVTINDWHVITSVAAVISYPDSSTGNFPLTNTSTTNYYLNFTDTIAVGTYNITSITAIDELGNTNNSYYTSLLFNVTLSPPTPFDLVTPQNASESQELSPTMVWQETSEETFNNYTLLISTDQTFSSIDFSYVLFGLTNISKTLTAPLNENTKYYWKVLAYDNFGSNTNSTNYYEYITDTLAPLVTLNSPLDGDFITSTNSSILFNYTPDEANTLNTCILYANFDGGFLPNATNKTLNKNEPNFFPIMLNEGNYIWNVWCNDSAQNNNFAAQNNTLTVDVSPPNITLLYPDMVYTQNLSNTLIFTMNASDKWSDLAYCILMIDDSLDQTKYDVLNGVLYNFTAFRLNGNYSWYVDCLDSNGFVGTSEKRYINVNVLDDTPPLVTINYPQISSFYSSVENITFNYTVDDSNGIFNCSIYLDDVKNDTNSSVNNHNFNIFVINKIEEGFHNYTIECYDTNKNREALSKNLTIDLTNPGITLNTPQTNGFVLNAIVEFNYTPIDANLNNCSLYGNFSSDWEEHAINTTPIEGSYNFFYKTISDGIYIWNVFCEDKSERGSFSSSNNTVKVDTKAPAYSNNITYPTSSSDYSKTQVYQFNITWFDETGIETVLIEENFSQTLQNQTVVSFGNGVYNFTTGPIAAGNYMYRWIANDSVSHQNMTGQYEYIVKQKTPTMSLFFNGTEGNITIKESQNVNITSTISESDSDYIELYQDGELINNGTISLTNVTLFDSPGSYNITAYYYQTQNYTDGSITYFVIVNDTISPVVNTIFPTQNATVGTSIVNFQYNVTDFGNIINCSLYLNSTFNDSVPNVPKDETQSFTKSFNDGNYTWQIKCYDNSDNMGQTQIQNFTVRQSATLVVNISTDKPWYITNYPVNITIQVRDTYGGPIVSDITLDILKGNSPVPWWNTSWVYRRGVFVTDTLNFVNRTEWIILNLTGLTGKISDCANEIRVVKHVGANATLQPSRIKEGDNSNYCVVEFNANITLNAINESNYYIYYGNPAAVEPGLNFQPVQINVQRGRIDAYSGIWVYSNITQVNPSNAFLIFNSLSNTSTPATGMFTGNLSPTKVNFTRYTSATANISWQVIEHPWISVQRGNVSFSTTNVTLNATINSVNTSRSFIIVNGRGNNANAGRFYYGWVTATFVNSTTITIKRDSTGAAAFVDYQVIEWPGATVQNGSAVIAAGGSTVKPSLIDNIEKNNSFLIFGKRFTTSSTNIRDQNLFGRIINSTNIEFTRNGTLGGVNITYFVVTMPSGARVIEDISRLEIGTSEASPTLSQSITPNKTFHFQSWNNTGATTAFINSYLIVNLTNSTSIRIQKQNSLNATFLVTYLIEVNLTNASIMQTGVQEQFIAQEINTTEIAGIYVFTWNTTNNSLENYSIITKASATNFNQGVNHHHFWIGIDTQGPNATLNNPVNSYNTSSSNINFNWTPIDDFSAFINCTLNLNATSYTGINTTSGSAVNYTIQNLSEGTYTWNVTCSDDKSNTNTSAATNTFTIIGAPIIRNVTLASDNQSIKINWSSSFGAVTYDIYIKTGYLQNFSITPNITGITNLNWTDNITNSSGEKYYAVGGARGNAKRIGSEIAAKKDVILNGSWILTSFPFNMTYTRLGNFTNFTNPIKVLPNNSIKSIYRLNTTNGWESVSYNQTGWRQASGSDNFTSLELGRGYWLEMNNNATITYFGIIVTGNFNKTLYQGWNIIGSVSPVSIPLPTNYSPSTPLKVTPTNSITTLWSYNTLNETFNKTEHFYAVGEDDWGWFSQENNLNTFEPIQDTGLICPKTLYGRLGDEHPKKN